LLDITELKEAEELYRTLANRSLTGIYIAQEGKLVFINPQFQKATGYSEDELLGTDPLALVHPEDREMVRKSAIAALKGKRATPHAFRSISKDEHTRWFIGTVASIHYKGKRASLGNFMDITEQKQAEETLKESTKRLQDLIEQSPTMIVNIDLKGKVTYVNRKFEEATGYSREEVVGKNAFRLGLFSKTSLKLLANRLGEKLRGRPPSPMELQLKCKTGEWIWVSGIGELIKRHGIPVGNQVTAQDITERKRMEQKLREKNEQLTAASRAKSEFLASMSHELRTPLNAVIGFSELMLDGIPGEINDEQRECLSDILSSGQHLLNLINDVLDLSKVEAGKINLKPENLDLADIVSEVAGTVRPMLDDNRHELDIRLAEELPQVHADKNRLRQILLNLLSNSIKFTPPGGKLAIEASSEGDWCQVSMIDNGIGIKQEDVGRIFEVFTQVDTLPDKKLEGTGLGLALCKQLVEAYGGKIWVESKYKKGSKFIFTLPLARDGKPRLKVKQQPGESSPGVKKPPLKPEQRQILVVDDDPKSRSLLKIWLKEEGYSITEASSGNEGMRKAEDLSPAVIILDILMPDKDGWQVLHELKSTPKTRDIPVVITSVMEEQETAFAVGAMDYFIKPVDKKRFLRSIAELGVAKEAAVLVVDDNPADVHLIASILKAKGIGVLHAYSGEEGVRIARDNNPALIVLDILMPDLSGFEVIEKLRGDEETRNIPIIVLTMKDLSEEEFKMLSRQATAIMRKTAFKREDFLMEVKRVVNLGEK